MNRRDRSFARQCSWSILCAVLLLLSSALVSTAQHRTPERRIVEQEGRAIVLDEEVVEPLRGAETILGNAQTANQWRQLAQFDEGDVRALLADDGRVYAGTFGRGAFVSTDNGRTWSEANNGLGNRNIVAFVRFGGGVLAASSNGGVFRTSDGGQNWTLQGAGNQAVLDFALLGNAVYAATGSATVFRSTDGLTWTTVGAGLPPGRAINAIEAISNVLVAGTTLGVFRSTDNAQTWTQVSGAGLPNGSQTAVFTLAAGADRIYLGTNSSVAVPSQVFVSSDNGDTWSAYGGQLRSNGGDNLTSIGGVFSLLSEGANLYAGSAGIFLNNGVEWSEIADARGLPRLLTAYALTRAGGTLLVGTSFGVYALAADEQSWTAQNTGLRAASVTIRTSGDTLVAYLRSGAIFYSTDDGQTWQPTTRLPVTDNGRLRALSGFAAFNNAWYVAGFFSPVVYRSTDNGQTWTALTTGLMSNTFRAASGLGVLNGKLYTLYGEGLHVLDDTGEAWTRLGTMPNNAFSLSNTQLAASGNGDIFITTTNALFRATDNGSTIARVTLGTPEPLVLSVFAFDNNVLAGTSVGVYFSTNNGQSFNPPRTLFGPAEFARSGNTLYAAAFPGIWASTNAGANWTQISAGLPRTNSTVAVKGNTVLAGLVNYGVFVATDPQTQPTAQTNVSAASFAPNAELAPEAIIAAFGLNLATATFAVSTTPLPLTVAGTGVVVRDSTGTERRAPLFFVSPTQVNYQIPPGTAAGRATIIITSGDSSVASGEVIIANVAPSLFAANASGQGVATAVVLRIRADGTQTFEPVAQFDAAQNRFVPVPIDLGAETDQVFLIAYGTGFRFRSALAAVTATIGGTPAEVSFAGAAPGFIGLDQSNLRLPSSLRGRGEVNVVLTADGKTANTVTISIR